MIRYALTCADGHSFESWFQSSAAYDKQVRQKLVTCPLCGTSKVEKEIMSPRLSGTRKRAVLPAPAAEGAAAGGNNNTPVAMISPKEQALRGKLKELREHLTKNSDYVGQKFPEEARKMH